MSYGNGTQYSTHCGGSGRVARILFDCDPYAGKVTQYIVMECLPRSHIKWHNYAYTSPIQVRALLYSWFY